MLESIKKVFNKLGLKHRHCEPPAKPHWTVKPFGKGYVYYQDKSVTKPYACHYRYTGSSFNRKRFKEVEAVAATGQVLFKGYVTI